MFSASPCSPSLLSPSSQMLPGPCMRGWALPLQAPPQWSETQRGGTDCAQGPLNAVPTWAHREANPGPAQAATCSGPAPVKPRLHTAGPAPRGPWRAAGVPLYSLNPACQPSSEKPRPRMSPPLNYQWGGGTDRGTAKCRTPPPRPSCSPSSLGTPFLSFCPADTLASTCRLTPGLISILASDLLLLPSPQSTQTHKRVLPLEFSWLCFQVPQTQLPTGRPSHPPHSPQLPQPPTLFPRSAALPCSLVLPSRLPGCPARRPLRGYTRDPSLGAEPKPRWRAFPVIRPILSHPVCLSRSASLTCHSTWEEQGHPVPGSLGAQGGPREQGHLVLGLLGAQGGPRAARTPVEGPLGPLLRSS